MCARNDQQERGGEEDVLKDERSVARGEAANVKTSVSLGPRREEGGLSRRVLVEAVGFG